MDDAAEEDLHPDDHEQLRLRPAVQRGRVRVHEREDDQADRDREQRLEDGDEEVRAVLHLVEHAEPQVHEGELDGAHQLPTAG